MRHWRLRTTFIIPVFVLSVMTLGAASAAAQVNINVNIGPPPPIVVQAPPRMVYLADPGVYVAVGIPYDVFFISGRYYYVRGDDWFWGPGYGGPWTYISFGSLPPGLRKFKVVKLREFREAEYRVYKAQGPNFKGRHFDAEYGPGNSGNAPGRQGNNGNGNGNGNGRGRGR